MISRSGTILVPTDFSAASEEALHYAEALGARLGASLHVIHVVPDPVLASTWTEAYAYDLGSLRSRLLAEAQRQLEALAQTITRPSVTTEAMVGDPAKIIMTTAEDRKADLIVMATHGRSGLSHFFMGSVTERVVRGASCPVMTVRAHGTVASTRRYPDYEDACATADLLAVARR
jgi:universal stress protein A